MKIKISALFIGFTFLILVGVFAQQSYEYKVAKLSSPMVIDASWNKPQWAGVDSLSIENNSGSIPKFTPTTFVKMLYDDQNIYVIFKVQDKFVRCVVDEINGPVWDQACVEFFFSPDSKYPERYFNLEVTCGGTPLICYNSFPLELNYLDTADIKKIEIAHSLPVIVDPEITDSVTWTLEYRIPIEILTKFSNVTVPNSGVEWKANFYKTASTTSNPHYITWAKVISPNPNFHLPEYFGNITFSAPEATRQVPATTYNLYPNPATDYVWVKGTQGIFDVKIFDALGKQVASFNEVAERINVSGLKKGIYSITIIEGKKCFTQIIAKI